MSATALPDFVKRAQAHFRLTPRECDCLALIAVGLPNKGIARKLGLAVPTVKVHLSNLFLRMQVHNRVAALVAAQSIA